MNIYEYLCHARSGAIFGTFGCLEWLFVPRFFIVWLSSKWLTPLESNLMQIIEWRYILVIWTSLPGFRLQTNLLYRVWRAFAVGGICLISQVVTEIPPVFENTWIWISVEITLSAISGCNFQSFGLLRLLCLFFHEANRLVFSVYMSPHHWSSSSFIGNDRQYDIYKQNMMVSWAVYH